MAPRARNLLITLGMVAASVVVAVVVIALVDYARKHGMRSAGPVSFVLADRPAWMDQTIENAFLAKLSAEGLESVTDQEALKRISEQIKNHSWVKSVDWVRRQYGKSPGDTIAIKCEFRRPAAMVEQGGRFYLVDTQGTHLEKPNLPDDRLLALPGKGSLPPEPNFRVLIGVATLVPAVGETWTGDDLQAGLSLLRMILDTDFASDIVAVDVANYASRRANTQPQIILRTRYKTEIWWGEPTTSKVFVEVEPDRKVATLSQLKKQFKRCDAGKNQLDIRLDTPTIPRP